MSTELEISIVMPCLNEAETLPVCIRKAQTAIERGQFAAEIVVADNGSTDGSREIAERLGARVVAVAEKGYGSALRGGITAARGRYVIMGDADDSYDFSAIAPFVEKLREGYDLVMGNRFRGGIAPGAMPWKHRWLGNPVLSGIGRLFFRCEARDFHCGLRGFRRDSFEEMELRTTGMEFASEMVIKSTLKGMRIAEVPVVLRKDGRSRPSHLRSWRDGWRHLRFMLLYSPRWLFLVPGASLFLAGLALEVWLLRGARVVGSTVLDIHSLLVAAFITILGYQLVVFALFTRMFAFVEGFLPNDPKISRAVRYFNLEKGLFVGGAAAVAGLGLLAAAILSWRAKGFGNLDPRVTMRQLIPAVQLATLGVETIFASFFLSILGLVRPNRASRSK